MAEMVRSKVGVMPPSLFENDLVPYDPKKVDEAYSAEYLKRREELRKKILEGGE